MLKFTAKFETETSVATFTIANLPELKGSEKQITWANDLRNTAINELVATFIRKAKLPIGIILKRDGEQVIAEKAALLDNILKSFPIAGQELMEKIVRNDSAKFWIDNKSSSIMSLMMAAIK